MSKAFVKFETMGGECIDCGAFASSKSALDHKRRIEADLGEKIKMSVVDVDEFVELTIKKVEEAK